MRASTDASEGVAAVAERALDAVADWHEFRILHATLDELWPAALATAARELTAPLSEPGHDATGSAGARTLAAYLLRGCLEEGLLRDAAASAGARVPAAAVRLVAAATAAIYVDVVRDGGSWQLPGISRPVRAVLLGQLDMLGSEPGDGVAGGGARGGAGGDTAAVVDGLLAELAEHPDRRSGQVAELEAALARTCSLLPPVELLLRAGGDDRQVLDPQTHQDRYGLGLYPAATPLTFASCTASAPSPDGFAVAARCRAALVVAALADELTPHLEAVWASVRRDLPAVLDLGDDLGVEVVPTPSGTDAELVPLSLCLAQGRPVATIVVAPGEVGSGTTGAAAGTAFAERRPNGRHGPVGEPHVSPGRAPLVHRVEVRDQHGAPRPASDLEEELERSIERLLGAGYQVLLHVVEGSKTEVRAPSSSAVLLPSSALADGDAATVAVAGADDHVDLGDYLDVPPLPPVLRPPGTAPAAPPNIGLLLRWQIALQEMRWYADLDDGVRARIVQELSSVVRRQLDAHPSLELVAAASTDVAAHHGSGGPHSPTIFSFRVRAGGQFLGLEALRSLYARPRRPMTTAGELKERDGHVLPVGVELGQPVALGPDGEGGAVLRLAIGAHTIRRTAHDVGRGSGPDRRIQREANDLRVALDRVERRARRFATA